MAAQREPSIVQRSLAEVVGTFLLVFIGAGAGTSLGAAFHKDASPGGLVLVALAHGLALLVAVYTIGKISGAHVNPAVSIALASVGKLAWVDAIYYIVSQLIGGTLGALGVLVVFGRDQALAAGVGATTFNPVTTAALQAAGVEALGAFILVLAIVGTATDKRSPAGWAGLVIGLALAAAIMVAGTATGASVNPARTFGPDIVLTFFGKDGHWSQFWVYIVGPVVGGVVAAWLYRLIARPDLAESEAAAKPAATTSKPVAQAAAKPAAKRR
ncbi:MAG TPA: MIP family channel protein [Ktedonobacterales bacterium]|nr:MIP family channel protein [Ktedonobacterales bacterium]